MTAKSKKMSMFSLMKKGQQVVFNAVPLLTNTSNEAEISYCSVGLLVLKNFCELPVPISFAGSGNDLTDEFKIYFMKLLRLMNKKAEVEGNILKTVHPEKFSKLLKR